jgi:hypothetical protein
VKDKFIKILVKTMREMFGDNLTYEGTEYLGKMISQKEAK